MAIGRIRIALIISLFVGSTFIPVLMETSIVPMINMLEFVKKFFDIEYDEYGEPKKIILHYDALINSIKKIECLTGESNSNQTIIQLTMNISNTDPYEFDMLFPGVDMTVYWKAGLPYKLEKETILGWVDADVNDENWHKEPDYYGDGQGRRWTRVMGVKIDPVRIKPGKEKDLVIKLYLYNDAKQPGKSSALGQMIGSILRTQSTLDPYNNETLMHLTGTASLDFPLSFPLNFDIGMDFSSLLNLTQLLGGLGGGNGIGEVDSNLFDLLFDVPLNIFDIQNYNDSDGDFKRDYAGVDPETHMKIWTEELYQHGAISIYTYMVLKEQLGIEGLDITFLQSSYNPDDENVVDTWYPKIAGENISKDTITNQVFIYIPESNALVNTDWGNKIFGLFGYTSDKHLADLPGDGKPGDLGDGSIITGGTIRLTGDLRENSNFSVGDGIGALITQTMDGIIPIGVFGTFDLMLNDMPLSICLDLPIPDLNISSLLSNLMGDEEEASTDIFSMLMDYMGFNTMVLNGLAFDTWGSVLQLNLTNNLDMFLPYGIYMPSETTINPGTGEYEPYIGVAGGPLQIFDETLPVNWESLSEPEKDKWRHDHLIMNISSLDSPTLKESLAKLMATIGKSGYYNKTNGEPILGDGIAYVFDDLDDTNGYYGNLLNYLEHPTNTNQELPNPDDNRIEGFSFTEDQFKLDLNDIVPDFGKGMVNLLEGMGIDPLLIEYLNNSIPHDNTKNIFEDLLSIRQLLNILHQDGPDNDLFDYLLDANLTHNETAEVIDGKMLQVSHWGLKHITRIYNTTYDWWNKGYSSNFWDNGTIYVDTTLNDLFTESGDIQVEYITSKLELFDASNLIGAILNLTLGTGDSAEGGFSEGLISQLLRYLPGALDAMGIDFDRIMPDLIKYLRINISQPEPIGYGIKPFELLDVALYSMGGAGDGITEQVGGLLGGISSDLIDNIMEEVVYRFLEQADPFQLMYATIGDLTPIMDYLNRSKLFTREVMLPLVMSLFPSGGEIAGVTEEAMDIEDLIEIIMPLITEMLADGEDANFPHGALNPFALLSSAECIEYHPPDDWQDLNASGYSIYQVGTGNYTPDYPNYEYLRLMSNLTLGLLMSGFDARDLWDIIEMLGLLEQGEGEQVASLESMFTLLGSFIPPTEWWSLLRSLGIWSTWDGRMTIDIWVSIFGYEIGPIPIGGILGSILDLEKVIAQGYLHGLPAFGDLLDSWLIRLCLFENQSYGNPYAYIPGYDSSYNTGPYRDILYDTHNSDNWGWVPIGWDPGGYPSWIMGGGGYGQPEFNYTAQGGENYKKGFLTRMASALPLEFDISIPSVEFEFSFTFILGVRIYMFMPIQLNLYLRLEGNPSILTSIFEEEGIPLMGLAGHFVGGDLSTLVMDMVDFLTSPSGTNGEGDGFPELDLVALLQSFLNADVDILHYWKYLVDPEFMKASDWYIDSGYIDAFDNVSTLIWDNDPNIPGDGDQIPDEFPWYRFLMPVVNQDPNLVDVGPGYDRDAASRDPDLVDLAQPDGPPGSGKWKEISDDIPDGIQHYWYDTPYAYVNTSVSLNDPWLYVDPYFWNEENTSHPQGWYVYTPLSGGLVVWGDDPGEQVPLIDLSDSAWKATDIPSLYYVPGGTSPGIVGNAAYYPIPQPAGTGTDRYPNIWNAFNITLTQTDYRFGYWDTKYDDVLDKTYEFLNIKPFYDLLSYAFYPQIEELLDMIDISALLGTSGDGASVTDIATSLGTDYYHLINYEDVYSKFGIAEIQPLDPIAMLQWLWDGAGLRFNGTHMVPYIEPYTVPDLQGALDWLADRGFTIDFMIENLGTLTELLATELEDGGSTTDLLKDIFSFDSIVNFINAIEKYMIDIVAKGNKTKAAMISLDIIGDMITLLDIYPVKAIRGVLNYLMPRLTGGIGDVDSMLDVTQIDLGKFLEESGLLDIIFENISKMSDLKLSLSIQDSSIDLYLFGQLIEDIPLDINLELDFATFFGGAEDGGDGAPADFLSNLPIAFPPEGFPYIELSTFNGPFNITFHLYNISLSGEKSNVINTNVTIGEVWYNETTGVYYFNRTQSGYEATNGLTGWTDLDLDGNYRTYVRPVQKISDANGLVQYSSILETDDFGWVDPYIYIHVEEPAEYLNGTFYWWNVTGHPYQRTLAGNRPLYKARWVDDGREIEVQSLNSLPADSINIDMDDYWEIFARVEIDGQNMPVHDVVYVKVGYVSDIVVSNWTGPPFGPTPYKVRVNASHMETIQNWRISMTTDKTKYILSEEITPTGSRATYPTISEIISGFHLKTQNWDDDSIYKLEINYLNLTGDLHNLYNFDLPSQLGIDSANLTYPGRQTSTSVYSWILDHSSRPTLMEFTFSPEESAEFFGDMRYSKICIDVNNFVNKTIRSAMLNVNVTQNPYIIGDTYWITQYLYDDLSIRVPASDTTYYFHRDINAGGLKIKGYTSGGGDAPLDQMQAKYAWFNYTVPVTSLSFLNRIEWDVSVEEDGDGDITDILITYYNDTDGQDYTLYYDNPSGDTDSGYINDWGDLDSEPWVDPMWKLYLTARDSSLLETVTEVTFAARVEEGSITGNNGIGFIDGSRIYNTSASVKFIFYPFVNKYSIDIPEGFISDFTLLIQMFDPLAYANGTPSIPLKARDYPQVNISYYRMGPMQNSLVIDNESVFAREIYLYLEAWDSLVREKGDHGDILFGDNQTLGTQRLVPLPTQPILNTTLEVIDLEAKVYINVSIDAYQTLRNYYLHMAISPAMGYASQPYTSEYRFSVISSNTEVLKKMGAYAGKRILNTSVYGFPNALKIGLIDLDASPVPYIIQYILTFMVSPQFVIGSMTETFSFKAVWEKAIGTYELRDEKEETVTRQIQNVYI